MDGFYGVYDKDRHKGKLFSYNLFSRERQKIMFNKLPGVEARDSQAPISRQILGNSGAKSIRIELSKAGGWFRAGSKPFFLNTAGIAEDAEAVQKMIDQSLIITGWKNAD